jgi:hypothetical protein
MEGKYLSCKIHVVLPTLYQAIDGVTWYDWATGKNSGTTTGGGYGMLELYDGEIVRPPQFYAWQKLSRFVASFSGFPPSVKKEACEKYEKESVGGAELLSKHQLASHALHHMPRRNYKLGALSPASLQPQ